MFKNLKNTSHDVAVTVKIDEESSKEVAKRVIKTAGVLIALQAVAHIATTLVDTKLKNL